MVVGDQVVAESEAKRNVWNDFVPPPPLSYQTLNFLYTFHKSVAPIDLVKFRRRENKTPDLIQLGVRLLVKL